MPSTSPEPSLPTTPIEEHTSGSESSNEAQPDSPPTPPEKESQDVGKGKGRLTESPTPYDDVAAAVEINSSSEEDVKVDDEADARKVEENLRRWELAERQKRKAARHRVSASSSGSIVGDVTRKASLLWSGKKGRRPSSGLGSHRAVRTHESEDGVPMEELDPSPPVSAANSPNLQTSHDPENPFENPSHIRSDSMTSLNTPDQSAVMSESSEPSLVPQAPISNPNGKRRHPPPEPLNLPKPRTPPPRSETPHANKPPEPIPPPSATPTPREDDGHLIEVSETRWWTDWLCGCNEGPDRGGDNQAGRTNPFA